MRLATLAASSRALDLSTFSLASGTYKLLVKAAAKPFLTNKMSAAVGYAVGIQPTTTTVSITTPSNNASVSRTPSVAGKATGSVPISLMQIYVDGVKNYEVAGSSVSKSVSVTSGKHRITVQSVDSKGGLAKATVYVTAN
jgi:hypothetical protein